MPEFVDYEIVKAITSGTFTLVQCIRAFIHDEEMQPETRMFLSYCIIQLISTYNEMHHMYQNLRLEHDVFYNEEEE